MKYIINVVAFIAFMAFISVVFVEWVSGCGSTYIDSEGVEHVVQCWIIGGKS